MRTSRTAVGLGFLCALGIPACEAQVGEDYQGEVQFAIEGTIRTELESNMRPRLAFPVEEGLVFVDGTVTGSFPSKFRFEVTEPPPPEALDSHPVALGYLVMMPGDAPDKLFELEWQSSTVCEDAGDGTCIEQDEYCGPSGSCRQRTLSCKPCEVFGQNGDPELKDRVSYWTSTYSMGAGFLIAVNSFCETETNCYLEYSECDLEGTVSYDFDIASGTCSLMEASGDTSLVDPSELQTVASEYLVAYAPEDATADGVHLRKGYNLLEVELLTKEEALAAPVKCTAGDDFPTSTGSEEFASCQADVFSARVVDGTDVSIGLSFPRPL